MSLAITLRFDPESASSVAGLWRALATAGIPRWPPIAGRLCDTDFVPSVPAGLAEPRPAVVRQPLRYFPRLRPIVPPNSASAPTPRPSATSPRCLVTQSCGLRSPGRNSAGSRRRIAALSLVRCMA